MLKTTYLVYPKTQVLWEDVDDDERLGQPLKIDQWKKKHQKSAWFRES